MIVSLAQATKAAEQLGLTMHDTLDAATVNMAYRAMAKLTHPDSGGSLAEFAEVDRAKHVLIGWLERDAPPAPPPLGIKCDSCEGSGTVYVRRGFSPPLRRQCGKCRGTGDLGYDREKQETD